MIETAFLMAIVVLVACALLFVVLKRVRPNGLARRQQEEIQPRSGGGGICRYGVDAAGEIFRVRVKRDNLPRH